MNIPLPTVSKKVSRLEESLGVKLFQRSTRVVSLTDEGKAILPQILAIQDDISAVESQFASRNPKNISGRVRISSVPFLAEKILCPLVQQFQKLHPEIIVDIDTGERFADLIEEGIDMALRIENPKDKNLVYKKLAPNQLMACASPSYLKAHKPIRNSSDLKKHSVLMMDIHHKCRFERSQLVLKSLKGQQKISSKDGALLTEFARQGAGVLIRSEIDVAEDIQTGRLKQVLRSDPISTFGNIYLVIPNRKLLAPRVRILFDFIYENFSA